MTLTMSTRDDGMDVTWTLTIAFQVDATFYKTLSSESVRSHL